MAAFLWLAGLPVSAATITVSNANDAGAGSLRAALAAAAVNDVINFSPSLHGSTITLTSGSLTIPTAVSIQGPGANLLTVSGNNAVRVFDVPGTTDVSISGLTIANGRAAGTANAGGGGGISHLSQAKLTVSNCVFRGNVADLAGGGIRKTLGILEVKNCTFTQNTASQNGGGLTGVSSSMSLVNCTFVGNSTEGNGGGVSAGGGSSVIHCTFSGNSGPSGHGLYVSGPTALANNIFGSGSGGTSLVNQASGPVYSLGHNLSIDGASGLLNHATDILNTDPALHPLQDNGGGLPSFAPVPGGPVIDAGGAPVFTEIQRLRMATSSGSYALSFNGQSTGTLVWNTSPSQLLAALEGLPGIGPGNVVLRGDAVTGFSILFVGALANTNQPQLVVTNNGANPIIQTAVEGGSGPSTDQTGVNPRVRNGRADIGAIEGSDISTQVPILLAPATGSRTKGPIAVNFTLPEEALSTTATLRFGSTTLFLAESQRTQGTHSFTFDPANPTAAPEIASVDGGPITDGSMSVRLGYRDTVYNTEAFVTNTNFTLDRATLAPTLTAPASGSTQGNTVGVSFNLPEAAAPGTVKLSFGGTVLTLAASQQTAGAHSFSFDPANPTASAAVASGSAIADGTYTVTLAYQDDLGNAVNTVQVTNVTIDAVPNLPVATALYTRGSAVPGAGVNPRIQTGAIWTGFGTPAINASGQVAYLGRWAAPAQKTPSVLPAQSGVGLFVDDVLIAKVGESAPGVVGTAGATFKTLRDPVIDDLGHVAFIAILKGVPPTSDLVVVTNGRNGTLEVLARESDLAPDADGAVFRNFTSVAIKGPVGSPAGGPSVSQSGILFTATLLSGSGSPAVTSTSDTGAWWLPTGGTVVGKVVREGDPGFIAPEKIKSFQVLRAVSGSPGQGRGLVSGDQALLQMITSTGRQLQALAVPGNLIEYASTTDPLPATPFTVWKSLGFPSFGPSSDHLTTLALRTPDNSEVTKANAKGIYQSANGGVSWSPVVRLTDAAVGLGPEAIFSALKDPVQSITDAGLAFQGTAKGGSVVATNNDGIWWKPAGGPLQLLAQEDAQPPMVPLGTAPSGAKWKAFSFLALPGGATGPLFVASFRTATKTTPAPGGVTSAEDVALYGVDAYGSLRELIREGQPLLGKTVKNFNVLRAVAGSAGTSRSFNAEGQLVALVNFTDKSTAIVRIDLPSAPPVSMPL